MKNIDRIALLLVIVGGLFLIIEEQNWLGGFLVGAGAMTLAVSIVYTLCWGEK